MVLRAVLNLQGSMARETQGMKRDAGHGRRGCGCVMFGRQTVESRIQGPTTVHSRQESPA